MSRTFAICAGLWAFAKQLEDGGAVSDPGRGVHAGSETAMAGGEWLTDSTGSEQSTYAAASITKDSEKSERARGVDAKIDPLKEYLQSWVLSDEILSDENAHETELPEINATLNIDDLWEDGTSTDDEVIVVDRRHSPADLAC